MIDITGHASKTCVVDHVQKTIDLAGRAIAVLHKVFQVYFCAQFLVIVQNDSGYEQLFVEAGCSGIKLAFRDGLDSMKTNQARKARIDHGRARTSTDEHG